MNLKRNLNAALNSAYVSGSIGVIIFLIQVGLLRLARPGRDFLEHGSGFIHFLWIALTYAASWPPVLLAKLRVIHRSTFRGLAHPLIWTAAICFLSWALVGVILCLVKTFFQRFKKPKADPPEEIALVEWDV